MKKTLKIAMLATLSVTPALADSPYTTNMLGNMENPLFLPAQNEVYSKVGFGVMYKVTDNNDAQQKLFHNGAQEFPIWRPAMELGYGITDRWAIHGQLGYTHNHDADRYGFHLGRIGTTYRLVKSADDWVWDIYGDFHMGGMEKMKGALVMGADGEPTFSYDNFSNGRWGYHVGTKFGKVWDRWTTSAFAELLRTWGNHNNEIDVSLLKTMSPAFATLPDKMSVDLKSTTEFDLGANAFYQVNDRWSFGVGLKYIYHAQNGIKKLHTKMPDSVPGPAQDMVYTLLEGYKEMHDRFGEFAQNFTLAYQATDRTQVAWFVENTLDNGQRLSGSTTDFKIETAIRLNVKF